LKVLITGVAGFIGSNLALALLRNGFIVSGIDNMSYGNFDNMAEFFDSPQFTFYEGDVQNQNQVMDASRNCAIIIHLAANKIPRYSDALDTLLVNSQGTENVAKAAVENGAKVIAASTSDVYGKNPEVPYNELSNSVIGSPDVKRWAYAISKMFEEQLLYAYHERYGIDIVLLRFFGGYGPNQHLSWWGGPQSVFITKALDNEEIPLHGDGQQTRSFTYISDHVEGIIATIDNPEANNLVFNLGNTHEVSIEHLAHLIWRLVRGENDKPKIKLIPYETFGKYEDVRRRVPDITRAGKLLGFKPKVDLERGLRETIKWQINRRTKLGIETDPRLIDRNLQE
jgi:UDP-glucose 4-epimerase